MLVSEVVFEVVLVLEIKFHCALSADSSYPISQFVHRLIDPVSHNAH